MKIVVTHDSPDLDAITSVWLIKKFLPGWESAKVEFVPAGERLEKIALRSPRQLADSSTLNLEQPQSVARQHITKSQVSKESFKSSSHAEAPRAIDPIEIIDSHEVIQADTGLGPLDHHQTDDQNVCGASLTLDYVKIQNLEFRIQNSDKIKVKIEAISRIVRVVVDIDHFKEVFWEDATSDYHDFSLVGILDGLKLQKPNSNDYYVEFISSCLDAILHEFENKIWAEKEIAENGKKFKTRFGEGIGFETINDSVIKLAQKMGYVVVVRKDPRKGYVRIKAMPARSPHSLNDSSMPNGNTHSNEKQESISPAEQYSNIGHNEIVKSAFREGDRRVKNLDIDLTLAYEKLKKMDPDATWYLHISKKMLLNGSVKNPKMRPTRLGLDDIIKVLEKI